MSNDKLIAELKNLKGREDALLIEVLEHILEFERRQLFLKLGFPSLYAYLNKELGYAEGEAYRRIEAARLMNSVPEIRAEIASGRLNITNMTEARSAIKAKQKLSGRTLNLSERRDFVNAVLGCSKKEAQRNLAAKLPELSPIFEERRREHRDGSLEVTMLFKPDQRQRLEKARDLLAHKGPLSKTVEVVDRLSEFYLAKKDLTQPSLSRGETPPHKISLGRSLPIALRRAVFRRDMGRCQFKDDRGRICESGYQVEIDHILPVSAGGTNELSNLRCLCRTHNQWKSDHILNELPLPQ